MRGDQFYTSNNLEKYPEDGKLNLCKKCITAHVDSWEPETYTWILQECDVPYVPDEWNKLMVRYAQNPEKVSGTTILGRYLAKMRIKQFRDYRWKDSEFLQDLNNKKIKETMKRNGYDAQEIEEVIQQSVVQAPEKPKELEFYVPEEQEVEEDLGLTEEDKTFLRLKWGKNYKQDEWVKLEQLYNEMMESYDIQSAGHIDTLKLVCKTSLKCNQLIDIGDVEGFQKMSRAYDQLMKSGKFTAVQNKADQGEYVDSISQLVEICEQQGFIPRYYTEDPMDKVDETLRDMMNYTRTLVTEEQNLGNLIENAVKEMTLQEQKEEDEDIEDEILNYEDVEALKEEDFEEFNDFIEKELEEDWDQE